MAHGIDYVATATVADALEILPRLEGLGLGHIGFKDVGAAPETLRALAAGIRQGGARVWMEIVSIGAAAERRSLALAREIGVEAVLGGTEIEAGLAELAGSGISYFPFIGRPEGHPTRLGGDAALVEGQARAAMARGAAGVASCQRLRRPVDVRAAAAHAPWPWNWRARSTRARL